jgi:hypothetical protein
MGLGMRNREDKIVLPSKHLVPAVLILIKRPKLKNLHPSPSLAVTIYFIHNFSFPPFFCLGDDKKEYNQ